MADTGAIIRLVEHAGQTIHPDGPATGPEGPIEQAFVKAFDAEGNDGYGDIQLTADPARAYVYADFKAAMAAYMAVPSNRPLRDDGEPNRPMRAFTVAIEAAPPGSLPR